MFKYLRSVWVVLTSAKRLMELEAENKQLREENALFKARLPPNGMLSRGEFFVKEDDICMPPTLYCPNCYIVLRRVEWPDYYWCRRCGHEVDGVRVAEVLRCHS